MRFISAFVSVSFVVLACDSQPEQDAQSSSFVTGNMPAAAGGAGASASSATVQAQAPSTSASAAGRSAATAATGATAGVAAAAASGAAAGANAVTDTDASAAGANASAAGANAGAAGAPADATSLPPPPAPEPLQFQRCGSYECAELKVPLDYAAPTGEQITIAVQRRAASGGQRIGSLLINPGGPGGSGIEFLPGFVQGASSALLQRFDIVAFDPRGVGESTPLDCHSTIQKLAATDPSPDDEAEWTAADLAAKTFADECAQKHAKLLPHLGTPNVARDMDQLRAALGDEKLTYVGFSYGTSIGAHYAELFPQNVRALVLDGALDMSLGALDISLEQAQGFDEALNTFFDWCSAAASNCAWVNGNGNTPAEAFAALSAEVDETPVMTSDRPLGPGEFLFGVIAPLYSGEDGYRALSSALSSAARGDGSTLLSFTDSYLNRKPDGSYGNIQEANSAVNCLDAPGPDLAGIRAQAARFEMTSETFGLATLTGLLVCAHWPVQTQPRVSALRGAGAAPILVVGTTGDPATPYAWAEALASQLESGVLLTYEGEGHTAYLRGVPCIDDTIDAYLIEGNVPEDGKRCGGNSAASSIVRKAPAMFGPRPAPRQFLPPVID
jgi:pimeloyl-ACP methyl ester carboxylesterase